MSNNVKISELPELTALNDDCIIPVVTNGKTHKINHKLVSEKLRKELPTNMSQLNNDSGYVTQTYVSNAIKDKADKSDVPTIPTVPTNVSELTNDVGYLTEHQDVSGKLDATVFSRAWEQAENVMSTLSDKIEKKSVLRITEDMVTVTTDATKGVSPYNTTYGYTNITVNNIDESELEEGLLILPLVKKTMVVSSSYRNVRIRFGESGAWHPVYASTGILVGSSYFTSMNMRLYVYRTDTYANGAFHLFTDSNSTYSPVYLGFGYATCTTVETTVAKVATLSSYNLTTNGIVAVKFTNNVPANSTLNINSKGAKAIYYKGSAITDSVIGAGDVATFIYNGSQYHLIGIDSFVTQATVKSMIDEAIGEVENGTY